MARAVGFSSNEYLQTLTELLPQGPAWKLTDNDFLEKMLEIASLELARVDADVQQLIKESNPLTASKTLAEYFIEWGIPDDCIKELDVYDLEEWRKMLVSKIRSQGLTFVELVQIISSEMGFESCDVQSFTPFYTTSKCDARLYGPKWRYSFMTITTSNLTQGKFLSTSRVNEKLSTWGNQLFECMVKALAPCHTNVLFQYK